MKIDWNPQVKLILADVDETIADVYTEAVPEVIGELTRLLNNDIKIFFVTGAGLASVEERVINKIEPELRKNILIAHCSGAEVCQFDEGGKHQEPILSLYDDTLNEDQKIQWRGIINQLISEFKLETTPTMSVLQFQEETSNNPFAVMMADRGPQITLEFPNSYDLTSDQLAIIEKTIDLNIDQFDSRYDFRKPIFDRANELLAAANLPVRPHFGGVFALDLSLEGVSKTTAVSSTLSDPRVLGKLGLPNDLITRPELMEIWGDKFTKNGGSDRKMCMAVDPHTRAIDFRLESSEELGNEFNIVVWNGSKQLHEGCLEYLTLASKATR